MTRAPKLKSVKICFQNSYLAASPGYSKLSGEKELAPAAYAAYKHKTNKIQLTFDCDITMNVHLIGMHPDVITYHLQLMEHNAMIYGVPNTHQSLGFFFKLLNVNGCGSFLYCMDTPIEMDTPLP